MKKSEHPLQNICWIDITGTKKNDLNHLTQELSIPNRIFITALDPDYLTKYEPLESAAVNTQDLTMKITLIFTNEIVKSIHRLDYSFLQELRDESVEENLMLKELIKKILTSLH